MRKRATHAVGADLGAGEEKSLERPLSARLSRAQPRTQRVLLPLWRPLPL